MAAANGHSSDESFLRGLRQKPLVEIVQSIQSAAAADPNPDRPQRLAELFETVAGERWDYGLFRDFVFSPQGRRQRTDGVTLALQVSRALEAKSLLVKEGAEIVLCRLTIKHVKHLAAAGPSWLRALECQLADTGPVKSGFHAALCIGIRRPYISLLLREAAAKSDPTSVPSRAANADITFGFYDLEASFATVSNSMQTVLGRSDVALRNPIHISPSSLTQLGKGTPWPRQETIIAVALTLVDLGNYIKAIDTEALKLADYSKLMTLVNRATDFVQCGWLTLRSILQALPDTATGQRTRQHIEMREVKALAQLAELERLRHNHARAGQYAVFAAFRDQRMIGTGESVPSSLIPQVNRQGAPLTLSERTTVSIIANRLGLYTPGDVPRGGSVSTPPVYAKVLQGKPEIQDLFAALNSQSDQNISWNGYDEGLLERMSNCEQRPVIRDALRLAIRTGNLRFVSKCLEKRPADAHIIERRNKILSAVDRALVLEYASAITSIQQKAIGLSINGARYRNALRVLWKQLSADDLTIGEHLFLHHAKVGFTHHALARHAAATPATWAVYESASEEEREPFFSDFVDQVRFGTVRPVRLIEFQKGTAVVQDHDVFVSVVTLDGHSVSIIAIGPQQSKRAVLDSRAARGASILGDLYVGDDWDEIVQEFALTAKDCIREGSDIEIHSSIKGLAIAMFEMAIEVNPNLKRLLLHCDAMFRLVPWQHVFEFEPDVRATAVTKLAALRSRGTRTAHDDAWHDFVVWHVPGVTPEECADACRVQTERRATKTGWDVVSDDADAFCREVEASLRNPDDPTLLAAQNTFSRLSLVCHGRADSYATIIEMGGSALSAEDLNRLFSGYALATVHACHGGHVLKSSTGDIGGLPAFLLEHGSEVVLASPLPVSKEPAVVLERYLSQIRTLDILAIERAYIFAAREAGGKAYYNLYTGALMPRLRRSTHTGRAFAASSTSVCGPNVQPHDCH